MEQGPGARQLQLDCVTVLNRNQEEIEQNISFEVMKEREKPFFTKHLSDEFKGIDQLVKKLAFIRQGRIRSTFPDTTEQLRE